jgi:hypothetical protein
MAYDLQQEADELEACAEWRKEKAKEYPEDAQRNLDASAALTRLAAEVRALDGSEHHKRLSAVMEACDDLYAFCESWNDYRRQIGFWNFPENGEAYLSDMLTVALKEGHSRQAMS